jgi:D-alanine-D-alanine ligase-like ATP-grasp enzyme
MGLSLPILIEELIRPPDEGRRLPLEFKCHVFGDEVAAIQVVERVDIHKEETKHRYYTPRWETFPDPMSYSLPLADVIQPPPRLDELAELATRLGVALGTYMRVDFFLSDRGWVFNEFSSIPAGGERMTPYCDELFGALWAEKFAHAT